MRKHNFFTILKKYTTTGNENGMFIEYVIHVIRTFDYYVWQITWFLYEKDEMTKRINVSCVNDSITFHTIFIFE